MKDRWASVSDHEKLPTDGQPKHLGEDWKSPKPLAAATIVQRPKANTRGGESAKA